VLLIDHYVAKSTIHGLGTFSAEFVSTGQMVWEFHPAIDRIVPEGEFDNLPKHVRSLIESRAEYLVDQRAFLTSLDGDQFTNHSNNPNLISSDGKLFAKRDINPGDELTCDYRHILILGFDPDTGMPHTPDQLPLR
jgi:uncharacterized protein